MNLLFTVDRNYQKLLETCLKSVFRFPREEGYDVYILHSDFSEEECETFRQKFAGQEEDRFHFLYVDPEFFHSFPEPAGYPKTIYYRILASFFLPDSLERILYLDPDTVIIRPLDELYGRDMEDRLFIACSHTRKLLSGINSLRLGMQENLPYINTGVMMMNLELLRKEQSVRQILEYVEKKGKAFWLPDQDIVTALYGDRILLEDSLKYNLSDRILAFHMPELGTKEEALAWVKEHTVVIHYCGKNKPWLPGYKGWLGTYYQEIEEQKNP